MTIVGPKQITCWECPFSGCWKIFDTYLEAALHVADHYKGMGEE